MTSPIQEPETEPRPNSTKNSTELFTYNDLKKAVLP
uniref:Uncharacterized protein n=1 Tax=Rhizophora mucronata TaxID=61149 RepID=A0A2P2NR50_RHIMU